MKKSLYFEIILVHLSYIIITNIIKMIQNQIIETKYCIKEAVGQIPSGKLIDAKKAIAKILGLSSYGQIWYYITGKSQPSLPKAKAVEKYFNETFGIKDVWKEVSK